MPNTENWEQASLSTTGVFTAAGFVGDVTGNVTGYVIFPTSDPEVVGAVWNDSGTLTISAG